MTTPGIIYHGNGGHIAHIATYAAQGASNAPADAFAPGDLKSGSALGRNIAEVPDRHSGAKVSEASL